MTARLLAAVLAAAALVAPSPGASADALNTHASVTMASGRFQGYTPRAAAVTYDQAQVPVGATVSVLSLSGPASTLVALAPQGLLPNRQYGAHVHTKACGANPTDSGPHYQNVPDPHQPSTDPRFANRDNEIWLDFTTDAAGNAFVVTSVRWTFAGRKASSVVIHEMHTHTGGAAGARLACLTTAFR